MSYNIIIEIAEGWVKFDDDDQPIWTTFQVEEPDNIEDWHHVTVKV